MVIIKRIIKRYSNFNLSNIISNDLWMKFENVTLNDLWSAKNIISDKDKTTIIWGNWDKNQIISRAEELKRQISSTTSSYEKKN